MAPRNWAWAVLAVSVVAASGSYLQRKERSAPVPHSVAAAPVSNIVALAAAGPAQFPSSQPMPMLREPTPGRIDPPRDQPIAALPQTTGAAGDCFPNLALEVGPAAMLHLTLVAPCHRGERVVVNANGLTFSTHLPEAGALKLAVPAMARATEVSVRLKNGRRLDAHADIPELALFRRVAVQWMTPDHFDLHALEFGAGYGTAGDVSADNPGFPADATQSRRGYLTLLGDGQGVAALRAAVYTFPGDIARGAQNIRPLVEAPITARTCGREMLAQTLQSRASGAPDIADLSVAMPQCAVADEGQIVALNGLFTPAVVGRTLARAAYK